MEFDDVWKEVTEECRDFTKRLLERDPSLRMSALEAQNHPWIINNYPVIAFFDLF